LAGGATRSGHTPQAEETAMQQKKSGKEIANKEQLVRDILKEVEAQAKEFDRKGMTYVALDEEQVRRKLARAKSPMIVSQGWSGAAPGGTVNYSVNIRNPDPGPWVWVFAHVFVGPANMIVDPGQALAVADARFPRLTQPAFAGLSLAVNETKQLNFALPIPAGITPTSYQGNTFVYQADWHDVGDYLDRGTFVFQVT
jgi:hypothetical protein